MVMMGSSGAHQELMRVAETVIGMVSPEAHSSGAVAALGQLGFIVPHQVSMPGAQMRRRPPARIADTCRAQGVVACVGITTSPDSNKDKNMQCICYSLKIQIHILQRIQIATQTKYK